MRSISSLLLLLVTLHSNAQEKITVNEYPSQVGDITFDSKLDDSNFRLCNESDVFQYYYFGKGLQYKGEKPNIIEHFRNGFKIRKNKDDEGLITIRFIVNCEGKTGRFRVHGMDNDYQEKVFSKHLTQQLLILTKQLNGWIVGEYDGKAYDYYQYLTFKIVNGNITEIMP